MAKRTPRAFLSQVRQIDGLEAAATGTPRPLL
jgi:hypothetical protein